MIDQRGKLPGKTSGRKSKIESPFVPQDNHIIAGDTIQNAFEKTQGQINNLAKSQVYLGNWDASANTPELPLMPNETYSLGEYYRVSGNGTFNNIEYTIGDRIAVAIDKANNTLFWDKINLNDETKQEKLFTYTVNTYTELVSIANPNDNDGAFVKETGRFYIYKLSSGNWFNELDGLRAYTDSMLAFSPVNQEPIQIDEPIEDYGINPIDIIKILRDINVFTNLPVIDADM